MVSFPVGLAIGGVTLALGVWAWVVFGKQKSSAIAEIPTLIGRPFLQTGEEIKQVIKGEVLGKSKWLFYFEGGETLEVYDWEVTPKHPVKTMLCANTDSKRQIWLYRGVKPTDWYEDRVKKYRLLESAEESISLARENLYELADDKVTKAGMISEKGMRVNTGGNKNDRSG